MWLTRKHLRTVPCTDFHAYRKTVYGDILSTLVVSTIRRIISTLGLLDIAVRCGPHAGLDIATREETHISIFGYIVGFCAL